MADIRLESFPFDSDFDGYDAYGYPVFDRAVSARTYRYSLEQFFTDGVFGTPANALQISKGTGLNVVIQPGIGIIRGGIGGVFDDPVTLELDTAAPQGNVAYAIMLRCDDNDDRRSFYLHVEKGTADANPVPPEPTVTDIIKDLRLGYVVVPSGATDLSSATVTNEKGLTVCPYAAPFEDIDVDGIVSDFRVAANEALTKLLQYFKSYEGVVDSALSDTEAGYLQQQITAIQEQLANADLSGSVDDVTIEYDTAAGEISPKLRVKDGGVGADKIADGSISNAKVVQGYTLVPSSGSEGSLLAMGSSGPEWSSTRKFKTLWEGSAENGPLTITGISSYNVIAMQFYAEASVNTSYTNGAATIEVVANRTNCVYAGTGDSTYEELNGDYFIGSSDRALTVAKVNDTYRFALGERESSRKNIAFVAQISGDTIDAPSFYHGSSKPMFSWSGGGSGLLLKKIWGVE